ncbi:uncharacterized protein METZ01_LOCUS336466 [marine metagenome]|uniref:Uncharacterized protein n=1 Tax=marine metagenome TaxID=408172 RepID=A0A382QG38_9ZZZZ
MPAENIGHGEWHMAFSGKRDSVTMSFGVATLVPGRCLSDATFLKLAEDHMHTPKIYCPAGDSIPQK